MAVWEHLACLVPDAPDRWSFPDEYRCNHWHYWHEKEAHLSGPWQPCSIESKSRDSENKDIRANQIRENIDRRTPVDVYGVMLKAIDMITATHGTILIVVEIPPYSLSFKIRVY